MKVHERAEPVKPAPAPGQFQRVLQQAKCPQPSARLPAAPRPPGPSAPSPSAGPPRPAPPAPTLPGGARTPPPGLSRLPGTAVASGPVLATSRSALASPENLGQRRQAMHGEAQRLRTTRTEAQTVA